MYLVIIIYIIYIYMHAYILNFFFFWGSTLYEDFKVLPCWHPICICTFFLFLQLYANKVVISYKLLKLKTEGQTVYRTPYRKVSKLKLTFYLDRALNNLAQELRF